MKQVLIIPARYHSSRLPGKPLAMILGKSLIQRVWERCVNALPADQVWIATDDDRIEKHCYSFDAQVIMTSETCLTGTDRVYQANKLLRADSIINVQGDEPLVDPADIALVARTHRENPTVILNGMGPLADETEFRSPTVPKVVVAQDGRLLYASRGPIPSNKKQQFLGGNKQICVYGFSAAHLESFGNTRGKTYHEELEDIEILRFLEIGHTVKMLPLKSPAIAVDIPEDIKRVEAALINLGEEDQ